MLIFINQLREKIGVMFGNPETTTRVARSGSLWCIDIRRIGAIMVARTSGLDARKVVKNKMAPPFI